ncbi:hypothetical protein A4X06_0g9621, partial [Tilletia controversa]
ITRMSKFAVPAKFEVIDELPKNSTGKILKAELRKRLLADAGSAAGASGSAGIKAKL